MRLFKVGRSKRWGFRAALGVSMLALTILPASVGTSGAAGEPKTIAEIALYQGPEREKMLIEGARKEGQLIFYNTFTGMGTLAQEFEKKYPFIKVSGWRGNSADVLKRVVEEYTAGRFVIDVIDITAPAVLVLRTKGMLCEYYSPEAGAYGNEVKAKGKTGVYYLGHLEDYIGMGFNTQRIAPAEAPKGLKDLLDPRWKGKISIAGGATGPRWIGNALEAMGRDYIEKLSRQDIKVHNISAAALAGLVDAGEVPLSPTIYFANVVTAKQKGVPVEWRALEPVIANTSYSGIAARAPHPYGTMLFLDYIHSREGQKIVMQAGLSSPREDMGGSGQKFKKAYLEDRYKTLDEFDRNYTEWENLMRRFFIKGK